MADEEEAEAPPREYTTTPEQLIHACRTAPFVDACELVLSTDLAALAPSGETPLVACASAGRGELITKLLQAGASPDLQSASGLTALAAAATNGHLTCVTKLVQGGAALDTQGGRTECTALLLAARNGHRVVCEFLLEQGADVTLTDVFGDTPEAAAERYETECRLYSHDFKVWQDLVQERADVIAAEPPQPPPLFPLNPLEDLKRFYKSTDPTKMLWRPGAWVHMKRPAAGPTVVQARPRPFEATGYGVEPMRVPPENSVFPAEQYAFSEQLEGLQGLSHWSTDPKALTQAAAIALERTQKNPQMFNDDVVPTLASTRASITDAASAFKSIADQEAKLSAAFTPEEVPLRIGNAPTYSSGLQRANSTKAVTAAVSLYPMLEEQMPGSGTASPTFAAYCCD